MGNLVKSCLKKSKRQVLNNKGGEEEKKQREGRGEKRGKEGEERTAVQRPQAGSGGGSQSGRTAESLTKQEKAE